MNVLGGMILTGIWFGIGVCIALESQSIFLALVFFVFGFIRMMKTQKIVNVNNANKNFKDGYLHHWNKSQNDMEKEYGTIDWQNNHKK